MSISLSREDLAKITDGECSTPREEKYSFTGVEFNSSEVRGGELFVALKDAACDGHDFIDDAFSRGAVLALVQDKSFIKSHPQGDRIVAVTDTAKAFQTLAHWWRRELAIPVLAITGSIGKTTVKEMVASILLQRSRGIFTLGSKGDAASVPHTILRAGREHNWIVLEIDGDRPDRIAELSKVGAPNVAVITASGPSHIGNFETLEAIGRSKLEVAVGLEPNGTLVLNGADLPLNQLAKKHALGAQQKEVYFGDHPHSKVRVSSVESHGLEGVTVTLALSDLDNRTGSVTAKLDIVGRHHAQNAAAATAAALTLLPELSSEQVERGLKQFRAPLMRLSLKTLLDGRLVWDDSSEAGPESMLALLAVAGDLKQGGKLVGCVFGDMLGLGSHAEAYHRQVAERIVAIKPAFIIGVGQLSSIYLDAARKVEIPATRAENPELAGHIARKLRFDILLVKGSRGIGLHKTVETLEM